MDGTALVNALTLTAYVYLVLQVIKDWWRARWN